VLIEHKVARPSKSPGGTAVAGEMARWPDLPLQLQFLILSSHHLAEEDWDIFPATLSIEGKE
jgi:hypothetical protein